MTIRHLNALQALNLAVRTGSLKDAAKQLSISPAAVGQRIKTLEDYLGIELLIRGRSGIRPTTELAGALDDLHHAFEALERVGDTLELQQSNEIHIAADSDWIEFWLLPRLPEFRNQFPNVQFRLNGEGDASPRIGPADCDVRFRSLTSAANEIALFHDHLVAMTSPTNAKRIMLLPKDNRLEGFPLLHLDFYRNDPQAISWPDWIARYGYRKIAPERGIRFQRIMPAIDAVLSDAGFVIAGVALLKDRLDAGDLVRPFPEAHGNWTDHAYCASLRTSSLSKPAVRQFRSWLVDQAAETRDWMDEYISQ